MADAQPDPPPPKPNPPQPKPAKKAAPTGGATAAEVAGNMPHFTFGELVDLALCAPEIGAVNFNILRLLLREMLDKTGIEKQSVKMTDLEAHQVDNFRNYVQGAAIASPMPGVLKIAPQGPGGGAGMVYGVKPGTTGPEGTKPVAGASSRTPKTPRLPPTETAFNGDIPEKVARLEKHIEALYQLPSNAEIIDRAKANAMSVNDMWQVIQLNNRIAAAEAAIQKMASLIEDLARNMNRVKGDTKTMKKDTAELTLTHSDLQIQGQSLSDKCEEFGSVVKSLRDDMDKIKKGWKKDRDFLEKSLGVDLGRVPSFMKMKQDRDAGTTGHGPDDESAEQFERGTQTFVHLKEKEKQQQQQQGQPPRPPLKPQGQKKAQQQGPQQEHRDAETSGQQPSRAPQPSKGHAEQQQQRQPKAKHVEDLIAPETIANMSPEEIAKQITVEEVLTIPPEIFKQMTPEQKKALRDIHRSATTQQKPKPTKPPLGVKNMTAEELENLEPGKIMDNMSYEEAVKLAPAVLEKMSDKQKEAVQKIIKRGEKAIKQSGKKKSQGVRMQPLQLGVASMNAEELAATSPSMIMSRMSYDEAVKIPPEVLDRMTPEQRDAVMKIIDAGSPPSEAALAVEVDDDAADYDDDDFMHYLEKRQHRGTLERKWKSNKTPKKTLTFEEVEDIAKVAPEDLASSISPEMALAIPSDELQRRFTPEQILEIERLKSIAPHHDEDLFPEHVADMTPAELVENLTDSQLLEITADQLSVLSPDQQVAVKDAIRKSRMSHAARGSIDVEDEYGEQGVHTDVEEEETHDDDAGRAQRKSKKDRQSQNKPHPQKQHGHHKHHKHQSSEHAGGHPHIDIVPGPIPNVGEPLPPMTLTLEDYMSTLPPEEAANLAADAVQRELQKQYGQLQAMQRQLAQDIQDKMEFIYQKLLKEIARQQASTSPYMAVGDADQCLGPGICTGHGMPAGIAVVKFPEVRKDKAQALVPGGHAILGADDITGKVCPGPGICPGNAACPYCHGQSQPLAQGSAEAQVGFQGLRAPEKKGGESAGIRGVGQGVPLSEMDEALLREMKSLMMLDLEKIREEMRFKKFGVFDEQDIAERLGAVWEALKILKHNEEALAIKIARQDALLKKLPIKVIEKLSKIPDENLDAMATGQFQKPMYLPDGSPLKRHTHKEIEDLPKSPMKSISAAADKEDIQTLFNNLANVIGECTEQKEKIDQIADTTRIIESGMVTKQMLLDALSDKADKGLFNTKVSYDEFGNTVDELHTQLHNLMVEGYQRNENWKKVTSELAGDLAEKLDKVELAPIKSFFKSHLKNLDEKVKTLSRLVEEPDPAGTRKRLLRDYNCLSCDRMVNISGVTNGPTLPIIGPILAGHTTASRRALDLHRMRMRKQFDPDTKNLNALERQSRGQKCRTPDPNQMACDTDVIHALNRYTGGSYTSINTADRVATQRRSEGSRSKTPAPISCGGDPPNPPCAEAIAAAASGENIEG